MTPTHIVYANSAAADAAGLSARVDAELKRFEERFSITPEGQGLVLAIESGSEPDPRIDEWRRANVLRRPVEWGHAAYGNLGRPYCGPWEQQLQESFSLPYEEGVGLGVLEGVPLTPAWICFIPTDESLRSDFNEQRDKLHSKTKVEGEELAEYLVRLTVRGVLNQYRALDLELMHLQSRETLWKALLKVGGADEADQARTMAKLEREFDEQWRSIWERRVRD